MSKVQKKELSTIFGVQLLDKTCSLLQLISVVQSVLSRCDAKPFFSNTNLTVCFQESDSNVQFRPLLVPSGSLYAVRDTL